MKSTNSNKKQRQEDNDSNTDPVSTITMKTATPPTTKKWNALSDDFMMGKPKKVS